MTPRLWVWYAPAGLLMSKIFRLSVWALPLLWCGCGAKNKDKSGVWRKIVRNGDELYLQRADLAELDKAIESYLSGLQDFPTEPKILGKLSRAHAARAYGHPAEGVEGYATARRYGLECLMSDPAFQGLVQSQGGSITPRAVETVKADRVDCLTWTTLAWSRWMDDRGVMGTSIDLPAVKILAKRAVEVDPKYDDGRPYAALGLALALAPKPLKPKLKQAREAFKQAMELAPNRLTYKVDLAQYVSAPEGKRKEWARTLNQVVKAAPIDKDPDLLENRQAIQRARALLEAGLDGRWED